MMPTKMQWSLNAAAKTVLALCCLLCLSAVLALSSQDALAHQQKLALTKVVANPRTQQLEVMHRFELHDAEHAVKELFDGSADIIASNDTQQKFAEYVYERFGIYSPSGEALPLSAVGYEIEGKHFWVYQETPIPEKMEGLQIVHNALRDIWFAQTNTVNIEISKEVNTLSFSDNTEVLSVNFTH